MREVRFRWISLLALAGALASAARAGELLYSTEGNRLRRIDVS